jgi:phosphomannomutase
MHKFIFDVDGTITPSRGQINLEFKTFFNTFCSTNDVYLITGSDKEKTIEQISEHTYNLAKVVYNCSGNDVWSQGVNVHTSNWKATKPLMELMLGWLQGSSFPCRTGNHIEERPGCLNFSIVGRNCTLGERKLYMEHDEANRERESIAYQINSEFNDITAKIGGETGIDVYPTGCDKSQVINEFNGFDNLIFFGDKMEQGGNDEPLAKAIKNRGNGKSYHVRDWKHTWEILKDYA